MTHPVPTNVRALNGNPSKKRLHEPGEPDPAYLDDLTPPEFLTSEKAKQIWTYMAPKMRAANLLCEVDVMAFARWCEDAAEMWEAQQLISDKFARGEPPLVETAKGNMVWDPLLAVRNRAFERFDKGVAHFGMSPMTRTRIRVNPQTDLFGGVGSIEEYLQQIKAA